MLYFGDVNFAVMAEIKVIDSTVIGGPLPKFWFYCGGGTQTIGGAWKNFENFDKFLKK